MLQKKTLFFISNSVPTKEQIQIKSEMTGKVCFRNALFIIKDASLEDCDFVFGDIPISYSEVPIYGVEIEKEIDGGNESNVQNVSAKTNKEAKTEKVNTPVWKPNV